MNRLHTPLTHLFDQTLIMRQRSTAKRPYRKRKKALRRFSTSSKMCILVLEEVRKIAFFLGPSFLQGQKELWLVSQIMTIALLHSAQSTS